MINVWFDDQLADRVAEDDDLERHGDLVWFDEAHLGVWFPLSTIAADLAGQADGWRRQRRIRSKDWPPWM